MDNIRKERKYGFKKPNSIDGTGYCRCTRPAVTVMEEYYGEHVRSITTFCDVCLKEFWSTFNREMGRIEKR